MDSEGCHNGVRGLFLLQVSNGARMQHMTLISRVQEAIRTSYSRFQHFMSEIHHG